MTRETLEFDVVIVGAGPAGLTAAIRLSQQAKLSICVIEKGAEVGAHILSGAVLEPLALSELFPNWLELNPPVRVRASYDQFLFLTKKTTWKLPVPPQMRNEGNYVIRLSELCRWLAERAEELGVAIFPGFAATEILYDEQGNVCGVQTGDKGISKNFQKTDRYQPGINLLAKQTLFAEGCHGSLTKKLIHKFNLYGEASPQTYAIGVKELWEIPAAQHHEGKVVHSIGWPLDHKTYGGSFIYHLDRQQVAIGFVIGLDYQNPYLDPFQELQRFKTHPMVKSLLKDGQRVCYGARALCEGGYQAIPKLTVPGGMLIGDCAGFLNVPKIKGTHTAMKSAIIAADTLIAAMASSSPPKELTEYASNLKKSWLYKELFAVRNIRPYFRLGLFPGLFLSAIDTYLFRGRAPWTWKKYPPDYSTLKPASKSEEIKYPKPDGILTFDKLSSVYISNTHYQENQPCHLQILNSQIPIDVNLKIYDGPEARYCPANVYEFLYENGQPYLQINFTNCVQCKTCDIKDPLQNINWVPPEGGDGPNYIGM